MSERDEAIQKLSQLRDQASLGDNETLEQLTDQFSDGPEEHQLGAIGEILGRRLGEWLGRLAGEALGRRITGREEDTLFTSLMTALRSSEAATDEGDGTGDDQAAEEESDTETNESPEDTIGNLDEISDEELQSLADQLTDALDKRQSE